MKKSIITIWILLCLAPLGYAQNNTVSLLTGAKDMGTGFTGDGLLDTLSLYNKITSISSDSSGNIYIYDQDNYRIRKINALTHIVTTVAGNGSAGFSGDGGPAVIAQIGAAPTFYTLVGGHLTCSPRGDIYFFDYGNNRIRKVDATTGTITTIAGEGTSTADSINALTASVAISSIQYYNNCLYFTNHNHIQKLNLTTNLLTYVPMATEYTSTMTIDRWGNIYYSSDNDNVIRKVDTSGYVSIVAGMLRKYGASGDGGPATSARINPTYSITTDTEGNIYLANQYIVRKIDVSNGYIHTILGNNIPNFNLAYTGSASSSFSTFPDYIRTLPANSYEAYSGFLLHYAPSANMLLVASGNRVVTYHPPAYSINTIAVRDTLLSPACTLPGVHAYAVSGTLTGTPPTGDSITVIFDHRDGTTATLRLPYYTYLDGTGTLVYGFGNSSTWANTNSFSSPATYPVYIGFTTDNHFTNVIPSLDTVGSSCNITGLNRLWIYSSTDTITTTPCLPSATARISIEGDVFFLNDSFYTTYPAVTAADSVYILFDFQDGTTELQKIRLDESGIFRATAYHNYPMGMTDIVPFVTARLNNGLDICTTQNAYCGPELHSISIPDCSTPSAASSSIVVPDSAYTLCSTPFNATFAVGSTLSGSSIAYDSLSYYVNFGDGSDTTITIMRSSDGWGNYFMSDTIHHTYYMPGAYTTAITPSDGTGTQIDSTLTVGSSCSHLSGVYYRDGNANCTADTNERRLSFWPMAVVNNTLHDTSFAWCDTFGHYALSLINGNSYTIIPNYFGYFGYGSDSFVLSCPTSGYYNITPTIGSTYTQDFAFTCAGSPTSVDMNLSGFAWGIVPGDTGVLGIWSSNDWGYMCDSLNSTVTLTLDPLLSYIGMWDGPAPTTVSGSTLTWNFHTQANLLDFHADVKVRCATTATMGASVCNTLHVSPTSLPDPDTANNSYSWCEPVRSSWDPNEKEVSPKGYGPQGYILNGTPLTYVVHFQNTGTARARNITINDTISEHLDIATLQVVSSSAPVLVYQPELTGNLIKFRFNDINLPDSGADFNGSNGYIEYNIYPKADLAPGTQIQNTAGIYFDYNPAVVTNTTTNTIEEVLNATTGGSSVCVGATLSLSNAIPGGTWSATNGHASVSATGVVTGVSAGIDTIWYNAYGGDQRTSKIITINPLPDAGTITGIPSVCPAATTTLTNATSGGSWTSSNANATVSGGIVTGVTVGSAIISYSVTNICGTATDTMLVTINPLPNAGTITGVNNVCAGSNTTLSNTATGGSWSSTTTNATVAGGIVTGITAGNTIISYTATNMCGTATDTMQVTVNALPYAGTITGVSSVCPAATTTLTNATTGGSWASSNANATVSAGVVTGVTAGSAIVSYSVTNVCGTATDTMLVTINPMPNAGTITGTNNVCTGSNTTLSNTATGGTWSSSSANATVTGGVVAGITAGSAIISYTATNICGAMSDTMLVTINPFPDAGTITGPTSVCTGSNITLSNSATGGTWLSSTGAADVTDGVVTGISAGNVVIFYSVTNICGNASDTMAITVNTVPNAGTITGSTAAPCAGTTTSLSAGSAGGTWSSSATAIATVNTSGTVYATTTGAATITYLISNTCGADTATMNINVITLPDPGTISGTDTVCQNATVALSASVASGTWSSSNTTLASVSSSGIVTGISSGTATISYQVSNACGSNTTTYTITILPVTACPDNVTNITRTTALSLYPNPNDGTFTISGSWNSSETQVRIELLNVLGQVVYSETAPIDNGSISIVMQTGNKLSAGNYLVRISDGTNQQTLRLTSTN